MKDMVSLSECVPAVIHDVEDADLVHVEDDPGQVANDKDEHNQHEDDGQVLVMSLPPSSPPPTQFYFNFVFMFCFPLPRNMTFILNVLNILHCTVQHYDMNSELNSVKPRQQLGLLPLSYAPFVLATS